MNSPKHIRLHEILPPESLSNRVLARIARARQRTAQAKLVALGCTAILSGSALVPALRYAFEQSYASGLYEYATLLFSDGAFMLVHWQEFTLSMVEALPSIALLLIVLLGTVFAWSIRSSTAYFSSATGAQFSFYGRA